MMWKIEGASKSTGADQTIWVEAPWEDGASSLADSCNLFVSRVVRDDRELHVVATLPNRPIEVTISRKQFKALKVSDGRIAFGVFGGLLLWSIFSIIVAVFFWGGLFAIIAGAGAAAR